jgi:hypothetical protein
MSGNLCQISDKTTTVIGCFCKSGVRFKRVKTITFKGFFSTIFYIVDIVFHCKEGLQKSVSFGRLLDV